MTETQNKILCPVVNIAPAGDIILVVGPEQLKLRVQSLFLKAASKVLCAILGPNWKEGHDMLGACLPVEILLPEEDATALRCICAILHHRITLIPQIMAAHDVLRVAVTAKKFGVVEALTFANEFWLCPLNKGASDLIVLAAAASLFQNAKAFRDITKALALNYGGSYLALSSEDAVSVLGERIFCWFRRQEFVKTRRPGDQATKGMLAQEGQVYSVSEPDSNLHLMTDGESR
ncbi:hypothetical protein PENPOL_c002G04779 [Penicillium polonicum]|uniref:BTB domain-containing protein n=1 Tax=Penicillium polonicum TaxID=60169 RepID=A0A1V6NYY4_PENPO|nr:hypothetical protein PENPOL_c002G04779 [Penicillium polonicum]